MKGRSEVMRPGVVISFEGISASGKTTSIKRLEERLRKNGHNALIKEDLDNYEGESVGGKIKDILREYREPPYRLGLPVVETLLICAKRAFESQTVLEPAVNSGGILLCDRDVDTVCAYQLPVLRPYRRYIADDDIVRWVRQINGLSAYEPDLTFYLEVSALESIRRTREKLQASSIPEEVVATGSEKVTSTPEGDDERVLSELLKAYKTVLELPLSRRELIRVATDNVSLDAVYSQIEEYVFRFLQGRGLESTVSR
jgi:thymidylate kinase